MDRSQELGITKAYCYFTGSTKIADDKLDEFARSYKELAEIAPSELRRIIANNIEEVRNEVDPFVDGIAVFGSLHLTRPLLNFWSIASAKPLRVSEFETLIENHPILSSKDRQVLRTALHNVYGQDNPAPTESTAPDTEENRNDAYTQPNLPGIDENPREAKLQQEVLETLTEYMTKEVFGSHLIPQITVLSIKEVKNAYVVNLKFTSPDGSISVYSDAVVMGKKILPPTEIYDESGNKIGEFDKKSFDSVFSANESSQSVNTDNYQAMMDELLQNATPVQAQQILDKIKTKYGAEMCKEAFDKYVAIRIARKTFDQKISSFNKISAIIEEEE